MTIATMTVTKLGNQDSATFSFLAWATDAQWSPDVRQNELEELAPFGTTDVRYRIVRSVFPAFNVRTLATAANYAAACALSRQYAARQGRIARIRLTSPVVVEFHAHIVEAPIATSRSGLISGQTGTGVVECAWTLRKCLYEEPT